MKVYKLTAFVSRLYFKGYGKLTDAQKVEWNNRYNHIPHSSFFFIFDFQAL